jgi:exodeoxyribonuclease-5
MLKNQVENKILTELNFSPTQDQRSMVKSLAEFILYGNDQHVFIMRGYAGTGKTSIISALVRSLPHFKIKTFLLAPTGRAAKVITSYSGKQAYTIHKKIYRQRSSKDGFGEFVLDKNLHKDTIFIVDEASMIGSRTQDSVFGSGSLLDDLFEFVFRGTRCKIIFSGDTAQLPPIGTNISPALDPEVMNMHGLNTCLKVLKEVIRQKDASGILYNATTLRLNIGKNENKLLFKHGRFPDIEIVQGYEMIEALQECYDRYGHEETIIVTRSNKRANRFNEGIRNQILFRDAEICAGDMLMVVKNNYYWSEGFDDLDFIANGDVCEVSRIQKHYDLYDHHFVDIEATFPDYGHQKVEVRLLLDTLHSEKAALSSEENKKLFYSVAEDYSEVKPRKKMYQAVKENGFYNALQVKFAYAVTCHKAQGGQWKAVFIDQGYLKDDMIDKETLRWFYTAFTRATEKIYLINFSKEFLEEE